MVKKIKTNEEKYKILDQITHILLRPGTYVGSNKPGIYNKFILKENRFIQENIEFIPSFIKITDEVLTNSVDESQRNPKLNRIDINIKGDYISIKDNGGIPIEIHKDYKQYIPEVIFGNLMSGSNCDDSDERTVAGLNGLGAKLTNVFSKEFVVTTSDGIMQFTQTFSNNMKERTKAKVTTSNKKFTEIKFKPDFEQFGISSIDKDHFKMIEKRVYDLAACNNNIKFYFNNKLINFKSFEDYIKLYTDEVFYESKKDKTWSIGIGSSNNGFQQVSFANSTDTYDGGTHVDYVMSQVIVALREFFLKKYKVDIKPGELKNHMFLFLNCTIVNPLFSSQTKEKLISEVKDFGSTFEISPKLIQQILKSEIVNSILDWIDQKKSADDSKLQRDLNKKLGKIKVEKLIDAKGKDRWKYSLALFEGDCLHEDTNIRVLRNGDIIDIKIKDINLDDMVITHNNSFSNIYAMTKKIKKKSIIKTVNDELICSKKHEWFVYDNIKNEFYFEKTENLDKIKHKLVKNYLAFTDSLLKIKSCNDYLIILESEENIITNPTHEFAVYNIKFNKFEMISTKNIIIEEHFLVNTFKL